MMLEDIIYRLFRIIEIAAALIGVLKTDGICVFLLNLVYTCNIYTQDSAM